MPYKAPTVDSAPFGYLANARAQQLAQRTGDPSIDAINRGILMRGGNGQAGYLQALEAANANQMAGSEAENAMEIDKAYLANAANLAQRGISSAVRPADSGYLSIGVPQLQQADVVQMDNTVQDTFNKAAQGTGYLANAGFREDPETAAARLANPLEETPTPISNYITPEDVARQTSANASMKNADANMIDAKNPRKYSNKGGDDGVKYVVNGVVGPDGITPIGVQATGKGAIPMFPGMGTTAVGGTKPRVRVEGGKVILGD